MVVDNTSLVGVLPVVLSCRSVFAVPAVDILQVYRPTPGAGHRVSTHVMRRATGRR